MQTKVAERGSDKRRHLLPLQTKEDERGSEKGRHLLPLQTKEDERGNEKSRHLLTLQTKEDETGSKKGRLMHITPSFRALPNSCVFLVFPSHFVFLPSFKFSGKSN
jgi:hypothetical protein